jgi:hypothetical protein
MQEHHAACATTGLAFRQPVAAATVQKVLIRYGRQARTRDGGLSEVLLSRSAYMLRQPALAGHVRADARTTVQLTCAANVNLLEWVLCAHTRPIPSSRHGSKRD